MRGAGRGPDVDRALTTPRGAVPPGSLSTAGAVGSGTHPWQQLRDDPKLIEAKHEFIQISIEVRGLHRAMVGTQNPALEQRCDAMHTRHGYMRGDVRTGHHGALVEVAKLTQGAVGGRTIRMHRVDLPGRANLNALLSLGGNRRQAMWQAVASVPHKGLLRPATKQITATWA